MAEQPGDDAQALAAVDRDRRVGVPQVVHAQRRQPRRRADRRREPDRAATSLAVWQHRAVAVHMLPLELRHLGLARAGVDQEAHHGDGDRMVRLRVIERAAERGELVVRIVRQVVRLEAGLAPRQSPARAGVLAATPLAWETRSERGPRHQTTR